MMDPAACCVIYSARRASVVHTMSSRGRQRVISLTQRAEPLFLCATVTSVVMVCAPILCGAGVRCLADPAGFSNSTGSVQSRPFSSYRPGTMRHRAARRPDN